MPGRAKEAPLVGVWEALETESLLGRRVRVAGRCTELTIFAQIEPKASEQRPASAPPS